MERELPICVACGVQYGAVRASCPICEDERQYVNYGGQQWTTLAELATYGHRGKIVEEGPSIFGVGTEPATSIGQRPLLLQTPHANVLWDMGTYLDDDLVRQVADLGGVDAIAISHPHFYGSMIEWAHAFNAPVYLHAADREWVARPDEAIQFWEGETNEIAPGVTLLNPGLHFDGSQVLHWADAEAGAGALFSGDIVAVANDRRWLTFMYSYPNFIPERPRVIRRALKLLQPLVFDKIYGGWWNRVCKTDGAAAVRRSAERYFRFALDDEPAT